MLRTYHSFPAQCPRILPIAAKSIVSLDIAHNSTQGRTARLTSKLVKAHTKRGVCKRRSLQHVKVSKYLRDTTTTRAVILLTYANTPFSSEKRRVWRANRLAVLFKGMRDGPCTRRKSSNVANVVVVCADQRL
jgi:hypothetical protein